jgi:uncharacterized protein YndB with AHSA1/START domain
LRPHDGDTIRILHRRRHDVKGHLIVADISGYTRFLTESELDHAHGIIGELLTAILETIRAPLTVSRIEGDAVFLYGVLPDDMSGQVVLESVEQLYIGFAQAMETMVMNTTCTCNACANISSLGLKIVMHCGEFQKTEVAGIETLTGADVIVVHRLLKNHVREQTGIDDYFYLTQACVEDLAIERIVAAWTRHTEEYEHLGVIDGYVSSLRDVWRFVRSQNEDRVVRRDAWRTVDAYSQAPPVVVWDHLLDPGKRNRWMHGGTHTVLNDRDGRVAPGMEYHCVHGDDELLVFTVLDNRPVEYLTLMFPLGDGYVLRYTEYLTASGNGTHLVTHFAVPFDPQTGEEAPPDFLQTVDTEMIGPYGMFQQTLVDMADASALTGH